MIKIYPTIVCTFMLTPPLLACTERMEEEGNETVIRSVIDENQDCLSNTSKNISEVFEENKEIIPLALPVPVKTFFGNLEIDKNSATISLLKWQEGNFEPLAVLVFESLNPRDNTIETEYRIFWSNFSKEEIVFDWWDGPGYIKSEGIILRTFSEREIESLKRLVQEQQNFNIVSWKFDRFYVEKALGYIDKDRENQGSISFIQGYFPSFKPEKNHYTNASYAAKVLTEYCYITGLDREPFKSDLTVHSLMKVAQDALPSTFQKPAEREVGPLIAGLYKILTCLREKEK